MKPVADDGTALYLDLLKRILVNVIYEDPAELVFYADGRSATGVYDENARRNGEDWPLTAHTMVGLKRLDNVHQCMEIVLSDGIPGDFIETGVWRGGVCIFMRAVLKAYGVHDRSVWVADSFEGLPVPDDSSHSFDRQMQIHRHNKTLGVSMKDVESNFRRYGLLDESVKFLPGWFHDSLPGAPIGQLAILRLDGDLYRSTMDALGNLYPKLSVGGYVIVDDYRIPSCRAAIEEFRRSSGIADEMIDIDASSVYWRRTG
jgi:hypothetical protein